jgi:hypothetical protein
VAKARAWKSASPARARMGRLHLVLLGVNSGEFTRKGFDPQLTAGVRMSAKSAKSFGVSRVGDDLKKFRLRSTVELLQ